MNILSSSSRPTSRCICASVNSYSHFATPSNSRLQSSSSSKGFIDLHQLKTLTAKLKAKRLENTSIPDSLLFVPNAPGRKVVPASLILPQRSREPQPEPDQKPETKPKSSSLFPSVDKRLQEKALKAVESFLRLQHDNSIQNKNAGKELGDEPLNSRASNYFADPKPPPGKQFRISDEDIEEHELGDEPSSPLTYKISGSLNPLRLSSENIENATSDHFVTADKLKNSLEPTSSDSTVHLNHAPNNETQNYIKNPSDAQLVPEGSTKQLLRPLESSESKGLKNSPPDNKAQNYLEPIHYDSHLVRESWPKEPWNDVIKNGSPVKKNFNKSIPVEKAIEEIVDEDYLSYSTPPHLVPREILVSGSLKTVSESILNDVEPLEKHNPIARLAHGLERVLFNPGVHWLRDPHSGVYNFTPWLQNIPKPNSFAFERLSGFIPSSRDQELWALAEQENRRFVGSTSSLTGMLCHLYFMLSEHKDVDTFLLSQYYMSEARDFSPGQKMPAMVRLNYKNGIYSVDSHAPEWDDPDKNVLTWLGHLLENFMTKPPDVFKTFLRLQSSPTAEDVPPIREAYRYAKSDKFIMRSQLDCHDTRLPGTGVFDIKTRACLSIRHDLMNFEESSGYLIKSQHGLFESFEREYYDLIRSAFLKYGFQARIGNMDGVIVAYHNTEQIFGFQYLSLKEMDERLFGDTRTGEKVFQHCTRLLEAVLEEVVKIFPERSVICVFETLERDNMLRVYIEPADVEGEPRPLAMLSMSLTHTLDGTVVRASQAMRSVDQEWEVKYQISRALRPESELRAELKDAHKRKMRSFTVPTGMSKEEAEVYWRSLNFSNRVIEEGATAEDRMASFTYTISDAIMNLRELSRQGRGLTTMLQQQEVGRRKIVLGCDNYEEESDAISEEPTLESLLPREHENVARKDEDDDNN